MTDYRGPSARIVGDPMEGKIIVYRESYGEERGLWEDADAADLLAWLRQAGYVAVPVAVAQEWLDARWAWESKDRAVVASAYELNPEREGTMANYTSALKRLGQATTSLLNALAAALKGDGGDG